jgi:hypothetical protein
MPQIHFYPNRLLPLEPEPRYALRQQEVPARRILFGDAHEDVRFRSVGGYIDHRGHRPKYLERLLDRGAAIGHNIFASPQPYAVAGLHLVAEHDGARRRIARIVHILVALLPAAEKAPTSHPHRFGLKPRIVEILQLSDLNVETTLCANLTCNFQLQILELIQCHHPDYR